MTNDDEDFDLTEEELHDYSPEGFECQECGREFLGAPSSGGLCWDCYEKSEERTEPGLWT